MIFDEAHWGSCLPEPSGKDFAAYRKIK